MTYIENLTLKQKKAIALIKKALIKQGITSDFMIAAICAVISKESNFTPKSEKGYANTSNDRIRSIFGNRVAALSEKELTYIKADPEQFFNLIYGGRYGNEANEGYKYRGRGFNQLTFKANYEAMLQYTTTDIVSSPDLLNELGVAAEVVVGFFLKNFHSNANKLDQYGIVDINNAPSLDAATGAAYHANTGWGKSLAEVLADRTGGRKLSFDRNNDLYEYIKQIV